LFTQTLSGRAVGCYSKVHTFSHCKARGSNMATGTTNTSRLSQVLQNSSAHSQSKERSVCISLTPH